MPVRDMAQTDVVTARRDDALTEAAGSMDSEGVGSVVVVEDDDPVGILTDRQIAMAVADDGDVSSLDVSDEMTEDPVTIEADDDGLEIARTMAEESIRRLPVVDDGSLYGIVTFDDVVATIGEQMGDAADVIESQSPGY